MTPPTTGLPDPAPHRSLTAFWSALVIAAVSLTCAIGILGSASSARAEAQARLLAGNNTDFGAAYLPYLDEIVNFRFAATGTVYLALSVMFASLALAVRFGPRWSVAATGTLAGTGGCIAAYYGVHRFFGDLAVGDWAYDQLTIWLKEAAPAWLWIAEYLPLIAVGLGLPYIGILLIVGHCCREPASPHVFRAVPRR